MSTTGIPQMKHFSQQQRIFCVLSILIYAKHKLMITCRYACEMYYLPLSDWMAMAWISEMKLISQAREISGSFWSFQPLRGKGGGRRAKRGVQPEGWVGHPSPQSLALSIILPSLSPSSLCPPWADLLIWKRVWGGWVWLQELLAGLTINRQGPGPGYGM